MLANITKVENQWDVISIYELMYYHCPSCNYQINQKQKFVDHACKSHPESIDYLKNISDGSTDDILCPWNFMEPGYEGSHYENDDKTNENIITKVEEWDIDSDENGMENKPQISENQNDDEDSKMSNKNIGEFVEVNVNKPNRASVWKNFLLNKATGTGKCKHCSKIMARGTTSMRKHLKIFHGIEDETVKTSTAGENTSNKLENVPKGKKHALKK